jgi:hypothetical protein
MIPNILLSMYVCVYISAKEIQTMGPISMKFGVVEWFSCMLENKTALGWPPEAGKPHL